MERDAAHQSIARGGITDSGVGEHESLQGVLSHEWPDGAPYFETYFFPANPISFSIEQLREVVPLVRIFRGSARGYYPAEAPPVANHMLQSQGWVVQASSSHGAYGWAFGRNGAFVDRQTYWEDNPPGKVLWIGAWFLAARVCMLLHLLHRFGDFIGLEGDARFVAGVRLTGTNGRYLAQEDNSDFHRSRPAKRSEVSIRAVVDLKGIRADPAMIAESIIESIAWDLERTDLPRSVVGTFIEMAVKEHGRDVLFAGSTE